MAHSDARRRSRAQLDWGMPIRKAIVGFDKGEREMRSLGGYKTGTFLVLLAVGVYWLYCHVELREISDVKAGLKAEDACSRAEAMFASGEHAKAVETLRKACKDIEHYRVYLTLGRF